MALLYIIFGIVLLQVSTNVSYAVYPPEIKLENPEWRKNETFQESINARIGSAIDALIKQNVPGDGDSLTISDIKVYFSTGISFWKTTGDFTGFNGRIKGLRAVKRITDVTTKKDQLSFIASTKYQLENPIFNFEKYKARYGIIYVDGTLEITIRNVFIDLGIAFNFNETTCTSSLADFGIQLDGLNFQLTGFAPFNGLVGSIVSSMLKSKVDGIAREAMVSTIRTIDCEKFRELFLQKYN